MYFQGLTITVVAQNATWVGSTINQMNFDSLNMVFNKVSQLSLVASAIPPAYYTQTLCRVISAIQNITNATIATIKQGRLLQAGMGIGSMLDDTINQRLTIANSLSIVTGLLV